MKVHKYYIRIIFFTCILSFLWNGCTKKDNKKELIQLVNYWQGKEIRFPEEEVFTIYAKDTMEMPHPSAGYKILSYIDSTGCTSCKLQLPKWDEFIRETHAIDSTIPFLFYIHPLDIQTIGWLLKADGFNYPICIDTEDQLNQLNQFPEQVNFQTFLLDQQNRVVIIGNPIYSPAIKELYLAEITHTSPHPTEIITTAHLQESTLQWGTLIAGTKKNAQFTIKNTGSHPLVILGTGVTCDCLHVKYDKKPVPVGGEAIIEIGYDALYPGTFEEKITIKCNTDTNFIVTVKGNIDQTYH